MNRDRPGRMAGFPLAAAALLLAGFACGGSGESKIEGIESALFATPGDTITSMTFAPDGRLFVTQQNSGNVRVISAEGAVSPDIFLHVDVATGQEWGLLSVELDPEFEENHYVYVYFTRPGSADNIAEPVLMRFTEVDGRGEDPVTLIEFPMANPEVKGHVGGGLHFGPDGYLYLAIGDTERRELPQDLGHPFGKIMRLTRDGEAAPGNPFLDNADADPRVFAYGFRNPFAFTFDPDSGRIYENENGPSTCDEVNLVEAGQNYGWPESFTGGDKPCQNPGGVEPIYLYARPGTKAQDLNSTVAPTAIQFVSGDVYPALGDGLLVCEYTTKYMRRLTLEGAAKDQVTDDSVAVEDCTVAMATDSEGLIYYSNGAEIRRLIP